MENELCIEDVSIQIAIFHGHVNLPEGIWYMR